MDRATVSLIVLAAGQGTRMNSDLPKVLHPLGAAPMLHHALRAGQSLEPERVVVVAGHGAEAVAKAARAFDESIEVVVQAEQLGTAHAVAQAAPLLADAPGEAVVLYGDTPFIRPETLERMLDLRSRHAVVVLGFEATDPGRYGRLVTRGEELDRIVEWKDATDEERTISLCNSGVICAEAGFSLALVSEVGNANAAGEYYLTDVVALARVRGLSAGVAICDEAETLGVNTRAQLAEAEAEFQKRARAAALEDGVTLTAPDTVFFALDTFLGRDAIVGPNVVFGPGVTVESGAEIRAFCHLEGCHISRGATVGPFARLRPGAELAEDVHVGNFVEIKNAVLDEGGEGGPPHLSRRRPCGRAYEHRRGHGHLQLRWGDEAPDRDRRPCLHRLGHDAGGAGHGGGARDDRLRIGHHRECAGRGAGARPRPSGDEARHGHPAHGDVPRRQGREEEGSPLMCGIVGVLGNHEVAPLLVEALKRLEYRGYDSAGIATVNGGRLDRRRAVGKLVNLSDLLVHDPLAGKSGIGHTRWATHGAATVTNAHPHRAGPVAVVHNGIIENFRDLRAELAEAGFAFETQTDTETVALLTQMHMARGLGPREAAAETLARLTGAFALCFLFEGEDDLLIAARRAHRSPSGTATARCSWDLTRSPSRR